MIKEKNEVRAVRSKNTIKSEGQRDRTVDVIKGIGIIFMVVRHARAPFSDFVLLFHMAIFFIASGYLLNSRYAETFSGVKEYIKKKIKGLWLPYFMYTTIFLLLNNFFLQINVYTNNPQFLTEKILEEGYVRLGQYFGIGEIVKQMVKAVFFRSSTQVGGALWFFMTLFTVVVGYMICEFILRKISSKTSAVIWSQTVISVVFLIFGYLCMLNDISLKGLDKTFSVYILIHIGRVLKHFSVMEKLKEVFWGNAVMLIAGAFVLVCGYHRGYISIVSNDIENPIFFIIMSMAGWFLLYGLAGIINRLSQRTVKVLSYISIHSVPIISLHFLAFKIISLIAVAVYGFNWYMIAAFPVLMRTGGWWILYTAAGVGIPLIFQYIIFNTFKHLKKLFLQKRGKIYIEGYYGVKNLGDDYILMSILSSLSKVAEQVDSVAISSLEDDYKYTFSLFPQLNCRTVYSKKQRKKHLIQDDVYIFGGGGLFPTDEWKQYLKLLLKLVYHKVHGGRNIIYGIDLCKLDGHLSRLLWRMIGLFTEIITVRNVYSYSLLERAGVKKKLYAYPDITFSFETTAEAASENDSNHLRVMIQRIIETKPYIVIVLAKPWSDAEIAKEPYFSRYGLLCKQMADLCNKCIKDGYKPVFLPFFHENDRDFINHIEPLLCGDYKVCEEEELNLEEKRLLFAGAKACISMRFHGIAFSLYSGTPCEAICYAPKAVELMKEAKLDEYCVKFGIRSNSCFFREFDMDINLLMEVYEKIIRPECMTQFQKASASLKEKGKDSERKLLNTIVTDD